MRLTTTLLTNECDVSLLSIIFSLDKLVIERLLYMSSVLAKNSVYHSFITRSSFFPRAPPMLLTYWHSNNWPSIMFFIYTYPDSIIGYRKVTGKMAPACTLNRPRGIQNH